jgi:predicted ATPase
MQQAFKSYAAELAELEGFELLLRVGVNTGEVIVASIGDRSQHSEDTAMGEAIALAARMETAAKPGSILVSENTYRLVESLFEWQPLGEVNVKGISLPVTVYCPLAPRAEAELLRNQHTHKILAPLIGREEEFKSLDACIEDLRDGRGGIAMVMGDTGVGKSRLIAEIKQHVLRGEALLAQVSQHDRHSVGLSQELARQTPTDVSPDRANTPIEDVSREQLSWMQGRCRSYNQSMPYSMWLDLVRRWLGIREGEGDAIACDRLLRQAETLWGDQLDQHYPYLATCLSLPIEEPYAEQLKNLGAEGFRHQFFLTIRDWVEAIAKRRPLVITFTDVHWGDTTSLDLLKYCLPLCEHEAVFFLIVFRPDRTSPAWDFHHYVETEYPHKMVSLTLSPLTDAQSGEFIDQLIGPGVLPVETRALILGKAEGNPYYIEELIRSLIEPGILEKDANTGKWRELRAVDSLTLPDSLQSLLLARIDRLSPEERRVLQMAAVIGPVFWSDVLGELVGNGRVLKTHLTSMQREQLILERGRNYDLGREYAFKSTLIRDAAYESILKSQRVIYHRQAAEYIEDSVGEETLVNYHGVLANQYQNAGASNKELFHHLLAAERARKIYANIEALQHYERALELLDQLEQSEELASDLKKPERLGDIPQEWRLEVLRGMGQIHFGTGEVAKAEGEFRAAIALGKEVELEVSELVRLYYWLGEVFFWQARYKERIGIGEEGLALLGDDTESTEAALMNQTIAIAFFVEGNGEKFREYTYKTAQFIQNLPYSPELRPAYAHIIIAHRGEKNIDEAMKWIQALERNAEQHHDLRASAEAHLYTAGTMIECGDLHGAVLQLELTLELSRRIGDTKLESWSLRDMGRAYLLLGDIQNAARFTWDGLKIAETLGNNPELAQANIEIGLILICQGLLEKAEDAFHKAIQINRETEIWFRRVTEFANYSIGQVYLSQGKRAEALKKFTSAVQIGSELLKSDPDFFALLLNRFERAYKSPKEFHSFMGRFKEEHPDVGDSPFRQWFLEPSDEVEVHAPPLFHEMFATSLPAEWAWEDPMGDCSFAMQNGLEIHAENGRGLWRNNLSAPRMLLQFSINKIKGEGRNFLVQTVCTPVSREKPAIGGILLWKDKQNWLCLDRGVQGPHEISFWGCTGNEDLVFGRGRLPSDRVYLRLECLDRRVSALCSADGEEWFTAGHAEFPHQDPVRVGLYALGQVNRLIYVGSYPEGTAIRFESFRLWTL